MPLPLGLKTLKLLTVPTCQEYHRSVQEADQERDQGLAQKIDREYLGNLKLKVLELVGLVFFAQGLSATARFDILYQ